MHRDHALLGGLRWLFFPAFLMVSASCAFSGSPPETTPLTPQGIIIFETYGYEYNGEYGLMFIRTYNFTEEYYPDKDGRDVYGWTAQLLVWWEDIQGTEKMFRVHTEQTVLFEKYNIHILRVDTERRGKFIELEIKPSEEPNPLVIFSVAEGKTVRHDGGCGMIEIGAQELNYGNYPDEEGRMDFRWTAVLHLQRKDRPEVRQENQVIEDQVISFEGNTIQVWQIGQNHLYKFIALRIASDGCLSLDPAAAGTAMNRVLRNVNIGGDKWTSGRIRSVGWATPPPGSFQIMKRKMPLGSSIGRS